MDYYPGRYTDADGCEATTFTNDGATLRLTLRGVEFSGGDFDTLSPTQGACAEQLVQFQLHRNCLCSCRLACEIPISMHSLGSESLGRLLADLVLGKPSPSGGLDCETLQLTLEFNHRLFCGSGKSGWFEDELLEIQSQLPDGVYMKACINCLYSDYSPYGHGLFGFMLCFRNLKAEYVKIKTKQEFWTVHDRYDRLVQETYLCPEFERRIPGTGYRG